MGEIVSIFEQNNPVSGNGTSSLGKLGEQIAARYLTENGYRLVMANFKAPVGRNSKGVQITGEIDLIAFDGEVLCFLEVKTRSSEDFTPAITAVDLKKQRQIVRTARVYRRLFAARDIEYRYDAITIVTKKNTLAIDHKKGYWNENVFRKRRWNDNGIYDPA